MSEYTPTTDQVRAVFVAAPGHHTHAGSRHEAFERWLASITAHTTTEQREEEHLAQTIAFEGAKLEAQNSMRHDPHVWHEALEDALDKALPGVWRAAAGFRRSEGPSAEHSDVQALMRDLRKLLNTHSLHGEVPADDLDALLDRHEDRAALRAASEVGSEGR